MQNIAFVPVVKCVPQVTRGAVGAVADGDARVGSMADLQMRTIGTRGVVDRDRWRDPYCHPLDEGDVILRERGEVSTEGEDHSVRLRDRREEPLERRAARHPELVRVGIDHPVGGVLGGCEPRHVCPPWTVVHLALHRDAAQVPIADESLEDVGCAVDRLVVGRDHEVDTGVQVVSDLRVDDVRLIADEKCLDDFHEIDPG